MAWAEARKRCEALLAKVIAAIEAKGVKVEGAGAIVGGVAIHLAVKPTNVQNSRYPGKALRVSYNGANGGCVSYPVKLPSAHVDTIAHQVIDVVETITRRAAAERLAEKAARMRTETQRRALESSPLVWGPSVHEFAVVIIDTDQVTINTAHLDGPRLAKMLAAIGEAVGQRIGKVTDGR